jgi:dihydrofolate reductase
LLGFPRVFGSTQQCPLKEPLPWPNSTLLRGDIVDALRALKAQSGGVLAIMGSGVLIGSLMAANLIDEYLLMIHPLVLGTGRRLFPGACTYRCGLPTASQRPPAW